MTEIQNGFGNLTFRRLTLFRISDFDIRIYNIGGYHEMEYSQS